jgi:hypothetical protein
MVAKIEKTKFENAFENLKVLYDFRFDDKEGFYRFLEQVKQSLYALFESESRIHRIVKRRKLEKEVNDSRLKAIEDKVLLFGSGYY